MRITITGINFIFKNGYESEPTDVELQYITSGFKFTNNKAIEITKDEYEANKSNTDGLRVLVVDAKLTEANDYISELDAYRDSLEVE